MNQEEKKAVEALTKSEEYISKTACDKMIQSIVSDFQWILNIAIYKAVMQHIENPEMFLDTVKEQWKKRAQFVLKKDSKRFQDTIIKTSMKDGKKLNDSFENILNNYTRTVETAFAQSNDIVDSMIATILGTSNEKETKNDK